MKINFLNTLLQLVPPKERDAILSKTGAASYSKGDTVFLQGDVVTDIFVLQKGLVKLSYITSSGKELVKSFIREDEIFGSLVCQLSNGPSSFAAICLEGVELIQVPYKLIENLINSQPQGPLLALQFFQQLAMKKEIREYELLCLSAEERYQKFLAQSPDIAQRIAQQELARYLGITPIALSRLKNRNG